MNMKKLFFCLLLFTFYTSFAQKEAVVYPEYDVVVKKFFNTYSSCDLNFFSEIKFEKRPDGWHIATIDIDTRKNVEDVLLWSSKTKKFQQTDLEKFTKLKSGTDNYNTNRTRLKTALGVWGKRNYNFCPYYGYIGWDWDVIQEYENQTNLPDSIYYGLGRAYSSYAGNLLNDNTSFALPDHQFKLPPGQNALNDQQLFTFRKYAHLAIENFKKTYQLNPDFETVVGSIDTKIANEYVTAFLNLRVYQSEEEANKELIPGLYNDFILSFSKNMLNSCSKNAILLTYGDNDTYPLLYLQAMYGIRKDVLIVNMELLQTDRYINSLRNKILDAEPLSVTFTPDQIKDDKRIVVIVQKAETDTPLELSKMIELIADDKNVASFGGPEYSVIKANELQLTTVLGKIIFQAPKSYFTRSDLIVYNELANSKLERSIYFSATSSGDSFLKLNNYLQLEGLVYKVNATSERQSDFLEFAEINSGILYKNLMEKYDWKGMSTITPNERALCYAYRKCFQDLIAKLFQEEKFEYAEIVLDKYVEILSDNAMRFDLYTITIIESYYKLNRFKKGNEIAKTLIYNIKHNINNDEKITYTEGDPNWKKNTTDYLRELLKKYDQRELLKELN